MLKINDFRIIFVGARLCKVIRSKVWNREIKFEQKLLIELAGDISFHFQIAECYGVRIGVTCKELYRLLINFCNVCRDL